MSVRSQPHFDLQPRRSVLRLLALAGLCLAGAVRGAHAESGDNTTKDASWLLGDNLSLAALLYNQGADQSTIDHFMSRANELAQDLGVIIKPFPARTADSASSTAELIHYLIAGDGALAGVALAKKFDDAHGYLFEVAVKSNLLILLYAPGDSLGQSVADVVKTRMSSVGVPENLWSDVVAQVNDKRSADDVKAAVFKMHKDVANYFIPGSG
jgi:hypothetical protein